jgi:hypothetical protein
VGPEVVGEEVVPVALDATEVGDGLYVGSHPTPGSVPGPEGFGSEKGFDALFLLADGFQEDGLGTDGVEVVRSDPPLLDDPEHPVPTSQIRGAVAAARDVADRVSRGQRVLVTCERGLNRAPLVAGLALIEEERVSGDEVVERMRQARGPDALSNPGFVEILRRYVP